MIKIVSFSYKNKPQFDPKTTLEIDCRSMANPHHVDILQPLDGRDLAVQEWLREREDIDRKIRNARQALTMGFTTVAYGCYGGKHRSVAMAEMLSRELTGLGIETAVEHTAL
jgi:UPF0042 nucleotide-binding protein